MYAIIRAGGKQAKVREGDVLSVERIKDRDTVSFTPLLVVADDGTVISDKDALGKATVTADVLGESAGPKVDIFKYKAKTGYRRRMGHRQKYTTIKVTSIATGSTGTKTSKAKPKADEKADVKADVEADGKADAKAKAETATEKAPKKAAPKKAAADKPAAKKPAATKPAAKKTAKKAEPAADADAAAESAPDTEEE